MTTTTGQAQPFLGARWARTSLQVNPFGYVGRSAPSSKFQDEASYNVAILDQCEALKIELFAVTDHWSINTARGLIDEARKRGIVALPGFEANSDEGIHLLVIFEVDTDFADVNAAIGACGVTPGCDNGTTGSSYREIMSKMTERGALVIPAHANVANGGLLTCRTGQPLVNMIKNADLHAIGITPSADPTQDQEAILLGRKPFDRVHPLSTIYADDICNPATLAAEGGSTWFKISSLRLDSLKLAVRTPATRVSVVDPVSTVRPLLRELSWVGGFLDGVTLPISADLTALIGGRGTGKSTVVESLRYVLGLSALGAEAKRDHEAIVSGVLRSGTTVRLVVDTLTPTPRRYFVERSVPNLPVVLDASESVTNLKPADVVGLVEIFGQHELAELAQDKASVARMVERFAGAHESDGRHAQLLSELRENRAKLQRAEEGRDELDGELADIPRLEEHVAHYTATDLPTRLAIRQRLDQDATVFIEGIDRLSELKAVAVRLSDVETIQALTADMEGINDSPQQETLARVPAATKALAEDVKAATASILAAIDKATRGIEAAHIAWTTETDPVRANHAEVLRELIEEGHDPDKYLATTKALSALKAKAPRREGILSSIGSLMSERRTLLGNLAAEETRQSKELNIAIRAANAATKNVVNVRPVAAPDRRSIKQLIERTVKGPRTQIIAAIDGESFSPRLFAEAARSGATDLESKFSIRGSQALSLIAVGESLFRQLEELSVGQAVDVRLNVMVGDKATEYRSLDELSKGQRATALLLLLLGASTAPLVIDQPEDDLDNRFVYDGIVRKLRELKGTRQIIASTHNANVPVLGDAELIVALEGDGQRGWPVKGGIGSLDDASIRVLAENLLEGGHVAFDARQHLYGF